MLLALNLLLTLIWAGLLGSFDPWTLGSGFLVGYAALFLTQRREAKASDYFRKPPKIAAFVLYYLRELILSNVVIAADILTPRHRMKPGVIAIPLDAKSDVEITLLANLITMTPGTLSLDVSPDRRVLYVHAMYIHDVEKLRADIKQQLERRVLEILR